MSSQTPSRTARRTTLPSAEAQANKVRPLTTIAEVEAAFQARAGYTPRRDWIARYVNEGLSLAQIFEVAGEPADRG